MEDSSPVSSTDLDKTISSTDLDKAMTVNDDNPQDSSSRDKYASTAAPAPRRQGASPAAQKGARKKPPPAAAKRARQRQSVLENGRTFTCMGCQESIGVRGLNSHHRADAKCKAKHHAWLTQALTRFV